MRAEELLKAMKDALGLENISDLRFIENRKQILPILEQIPSSRYAPHIWKDAVQYLTEQEMDFFVSEEAKKYLQTHICNDLSEG